MRTYDKQTRKALKRLFENAIKSVEKKRFRSASELGIFSRCLLEIIRDAEPFTNDERSAVKYFKRKTKLGLEHDSQWTNTLLRGIKFRHIGCGIQPDPRLRVPKPPVANA